MGERKKKKRGQQREIIVPLPLDSTLNRLTNRAAQLRCTVSINTRKTDRRELDVAIGYVGRDKEGQQIVYEFWRTSVTLERLEDYSTQVSYTAIRPQFIMCLPLILLVPLCFGIAIASNISFVALLWNAECWIMLVILGSIGLLINLPFLLHRRRALLTLLHNLDKSLNEI